MQPKQQINICHVNDVDAADDYASLPPIQSNQQGAPYVLGYWWASRVRPDLAELVCDDAFVVLMDGRRWV